MLKYILIALFAFTLTPHSAQAQDAQAPAPEQTTQKPLVTYSPDFCEFEVRFPSEPYTQRQCDKPGTQEKCYDLVSYTQVFDMASTVNVRVICNPIDQNIIDTYNNDVMKATLQAMTKPSVTQTFETSIHEDEKGRYKQAALIGEGKVGQLPSIYIAQLWIGKKSAFSVEAELIGEELEEADTLYSHILKSVKFSEAKAEPEESEEKTNEKPKN